MARPKKDYSEMEFEDRIQLYLKRKKYSIEDFSEIVGKKGKTEEVKQMLDNFFKFDSRHIRKILSYFPDLNARWLLLGLGEIEEKSLNQVTKQLQDCKRQYEALKKKYDDETRFMMTDDLPAVGSNSGAKGKQKASKK